MNKLMLLVLGCTMLGCVSTSSAKLDNDKMEAPSTALLPLAPLPANETYEVDPETKACIDAGGKTIELKKDGEAVSFCELGRALIAQETLFRQTKLQEPQAAIELYLKHPSMKKDRSRRGRKLKILSMGNPAILYCLQQRGTSIQYEGPDGSVAICRLKDGSSMAAWTLFNGPDGAEQLTSQVAPDRSQPIQAAFRKD
jgi:putative hemolysin